MEDYESKKFIAKADNITLGELVRAFIDKAAGGTELSEDEYIEPADGLIHCKKCGGRR